MADKVQMPMSTAGLTRFFDDYKSKIEFKPGHVIVMVVVVLVVVVLLHLWGKALIG